MKNNKKNQYGQLQTIPMSLQITKKEKRFMDDKWQ